MLLFQLFQLRGVTEIPVSDYTLKQLGGQGAEARVRLTAPTTYSSKLGMWLCSAPHLEIMQ